MKISNLEKLVLGVVIMASLTGCDVGNAPSGGSPAEVENNFKKEDPQTQINTIRMSPASEERKAQLIKEIEDKYHIKASDAPTGAPAHS
jgi:hypothetical protein